MRFIKAVVGSQSLVVSPWSFASRRSLFAFGCSVEETPNPNLSHISERPPTNDQRLFCFLIKSPLPSKLRLVPLKRRLLRDLDWLLSRRKHALLAASDFLVCVQAFQNELRRRHLHLAAVIRADVQLDEFFHQPLNLAQPFEHLLSCGIVAELNLAAQIEPLHHLTQVDAV